MQKYIVMVSFGYYDDIETENFLMQAENMDELKKLIELEFIKSKDHFGGELYPNASATIYSLEDLANYQFDDEPMLGYETSNVTKIGYFMNEYIGDRQCNKH